MKESVALAKDADAKKDFSSTRSDNSIHRVRNEPEKQLGSLRRVIDSIRSDGGTPSLDSIATELSSMHTAQRASVLLALQRTHGNRYVQRVVTGIQAKLKVGQPGDVYEQEADRVAEQLMRMPEPRMQRQAEEKEEEEELIQIKPLAEQITLFVQRQVEEEDEEKKKEEEEEILQTKEVSGQTPEVASDFESRIQSLGGGGQPLPESVRTFFEPRFGYDFSQVQVHTDGHAAGLARSVNARAFTRGKDIIFGGGQYAPETSSGKKLLAHELTHVVQQHPMLQKDLSAVPLVDDIYGKEASENARAIIEHHSTQAQQLFFDSTVVQLQGSGPSIKNPVNESVRIIKTSGRLAKAKKGSFEEKLSGAAKLLSEDMVQGIFFAEEKRHGLEKEALEFIGRAKTYGKGQIGGPAVSDVESYFPDEKKSFEKVFGPAPSGWKERVEDNNWGAFYAAAYLTLNIAKREKPRRSKDDQVKLGSAIYHGGWKRVTEAQNKVAKNLKKKTEDLTWNEIAKELVKSKKGKDLVDYVNEVATFRKFLQFPFEFDIKARLPESRKFYVPHSGSVMVTCFAEYEENRAKSDIYVATTYYIMLHRVRTGPDSDEGKVLYNISKKQSHIWKNLELGNYYMEVWKNEPGGFSPYHLKGEGVVDVK